MTGGKEANESGNAWEGWVKQVAVKHNFVLLPYKEREEYLRTHPEPRVVWLRAPYNTLYNTSKTPRTNSEFVFETKSEQIRVECKWQNGSGSVDEKFPFMFINSILSIKEPTIVFALGGDYFFSGRGMEVRQWLENACSQPPEWLSDAAKQQWAGKTLKVVTTNTFEKWFRDRFSK